MKKLINSPDTVVTDALAGVAAAHPSLAVDIENKVITRAGVPQAGKVGLVSGGGSGHEPLHGGFVGYGMLDAACPGEVFTSPVPDQMLAATKAVNGGPGSCTSSRTTPATCSTSRWPPSWPATRASRSSRW